MRSFTGWGVALAAMTLSAPVLSADLGGSCCSDLEERVAELEATVARKGNRKVSVEVSGHVNQVMVWSDYDAIDLGGPLSTAGGSDHAQIVSDPRSQSRFRFKGSARINQEWSAGYLMEIGASNSELSVRHNALYVKSNGFGTLWLGHTADAVDGITHIDLGERTSVNLDMTLYRSLLGDELGIGFAPFSVTVPLAQLAGLATDFEGTRANLIRYVSPTVAGFVLSASWADDETASVALRYAGEFGAIRVAGGVGYQKRKDRSVDVPVSLSLGPISADGISVSLPIGESNVMSGSLSVQHTPSGMFLTGSAAEIDFKDLDAKSFGWALAGGLSGKWTNAGKTIIAVEYGEVDVSAGGVDLTDSRYWGVELSQEIDAAAMRISITYRAIEADYGFVKDDVDVIGVGAKIKF